jgi:hypothetical protein
MVDVPCKDTHSLTYECNEDFTAYIYRTPHVRQQERRSKAEQKPHSLRPTPAKNAMLHNLPNAPLSVIKTSTPRVRVVQSEVDALHASPPPLHTHTIRTVAASGLHSTRRIIGNDVAERGSCPESLAHRPGSNSCWTDRSDAEQVNGEKKLE